MRIGSHNFDEYTIFESKKNRTRRLCTKMHKELGGGITFAPYSCEADVLFWLAQRSPAEIS